MRFYLITIMILDCIYPCVLRKKRHCLEKNLLKGRVHPDTFIEVEEFIESTEVKNPGSTVTQPLEQHETNYFLGRPLYYYPTNELNEGEQVNRAVSNIENIVFNPENIAVGNRDISNVENVIIDKNLISDQIEESFADVRKYMESVLTEKQLSHYLPKLMNLKINYDLVNDNEEKFNSLYSICKSFDTILLAVMDKLLLNFDINAEFNQEDFDKFKIELHDAIYSDIDLHFLKGQIRIKFNVEMKLLFYTELKNCAKHFGLIPELMTLNGVFYRRSIDNIIVLIHSINLLIEKRKDNPFLKIFVLFLIRRIFEYSKSIGFDVFTIDKIILDCPNNQNNVYFFIWEFDYSRRKQLKSKYAYNELFHCSETDKIHLRIVLLIFLYQQIIFLKWNNANYEEFKRYVDLIKRVINDNKCPDCDYDEYLKLLENYK